MATDVTLALILRHYGVRFRDGRDGWQSVLCPVHKDTRPSARANLTLGLVYCNGCGFSGGAVKLIGQIENVDRNRALAIFGEITGGQDKPVSGRTSQKRYRPRIFGR